MCFIICTSYTNRWALDLQGGKDLNSNIPDVDSLYRNGDEDCDLVEVIQKNEIEDYYNKDKKVNKIIKDVGKDYKGLISWDHLFYS